MAHELLDGLGGLWRLIRLVTWDLVWTGGLRQLGRGVLLVCSWGRFPRGQQLERHSNLVSCIGLLTVVLAWGAVVLWNQQHPQPPANAPTTATSSHSPPARPAP